MPMSDVHKSNMDEVIEEFRKEIKRKAVILDIGGFRPTEAPFASWFGKVSFFQSQAYPTVL